jgi:protein-S-isoprenylcysteine O-methyltransferase Ste14
MSSGRPPSGKLSPVRIAVNVALGVWVVSEWGIRLRSLLNRQGARLDHSSRLVVVASALTGVGGGIALSRALPEAAMPDARWLLVAGLVLMGAGIAFRQWAVAVLGRFFTVDVRVHPGQTVVEQGPYRWLRHPSYTGLIATFLGLGLALDNWRRWRCWPCCRPPASSTASTSRSVRCSTASASRTAASPQAARACSPECGNSRP